MNCSTCNGTGEIFVSCCTNEVVDSDIQRCPKCKEGLGPETCEDCNGTGKGEEQARNFLFKRNLVPIQIDNYYTVIVYSFGESFRMIIKVYETNFQVTKQGGKEFLDCTAEVLMYGSTDQFFSDYSDCSYYVEQKGGKVERDYRKSSTKEIKWFEECKKVQKFIPRKFSLLERLLNFEK